MLSRVSDPGQCGLAGGCATGSGAHRGQITMPLPLPLDLRLRRHAATAGAFSGRVPLLVSVVAVSVLAAPGAVARR